MRTESIAGTIVMIQCGGSTVAVGTITTVGFETVRLIRAIKIIIEIVHSITILSYNSNQTRDTSQKKLFIIPEWDFLAQIGCY